MLQSDCPATYGGTSALTRVKATIIIPELKTEKGKIKDGIAKG